MTHTKLQDSNGDYDSYHMPRDSVESRGIWCEALSIYEWSALYTSHGHMIWLSHGAFDLRHGQYISDWHFIWVMVIWNLWVMRHLVWGMVNIWVIGTLYESWSHEMTESWGIWYKAHSIYEWSALCMSHGRLSAEAFAMRHGQCISNWYFEWVMLIW